MLQYATYNMQHNIIKFNRETLKSVNNWINIEDWNIPNSLFNYGLPGCVFHLINLPIDENKTEVDMICNYLIDVSKLNNKIHYLEIGVSVGKTFYQIIEFSKIFLNNITEITFSCIDIEKINPIFEDILDNKYHQKIRMQIPKDETLIHSIKTNDNSITKWDNIIYYEADEFDKNIWMNMKNKYNFVFSDALHDPVALTHEYENLKKYNLLDEEGFIYCFDDLENETNQPMWNSVNAIYDNIKKSYPLLNVTLEHFVVNGWIGQYEHPHNFGVIKAFPL